MAEIKRYTTPVFRISFPEVITAKSFDGGPEKFSCQAIWNPAKFSAKDKGLWKEMLKALDAESMTRFKKKVKDLPANYRTGLRDGSEKPDMEGYGEGKKFATLSTLMAPGVVDRDKTPISVAEGNTDEIYPGAWFRATVNAFSYDNKGKGVAFGLMNLQKVKDGPRLDSRVDAASDFEDDIEDEWLEDDEDDDDFLD